MKSNDWMIIFVLALLVVFLAACGKATAGYDHYIPGYTFPPQFHGIWIETNSPETCADQHDNLYISAGYMEDFEISCEVNKAKFRNGALEFKSSCQLNGSQPFGIDGSLRLSGNKLIVKKTDPWKNDHMRTTVYKRCPALK